MGRASRQPLRLHLLHAVSLCKRLCFEDWLSIPSPIADAQFPQSRVGSTAPVLLANQMSATTCLSQQPGTAAIARPLPDGQPTIIASRSTKEIHNIQSRTSIAPKPGSTIHHPVFHQRQDSERRVNDKSPLLWLPPCWPPTSLATLVSKEFTA